MTRLNTHEQVTQSQLALQRQRQIGYANGKLDQIERNARRGKGRRSAKKKGGER